MEINDSFNIMDCVNPKGFVIITNKNTGEILLKKHNMILTEGRKVILSKLLNGFNNYTSKENLTDYSDYQFKCVCFSSNAQETKKDMKISNENLGFVSKMENNKEQNLNRKYFSYALNSGNFTLENDNENFYFKINTNVSLPIGAESGVIDHISSLGIIMEKVSSGAELLFSRISFDPIQISADTTFELTYYIYF